MKINVPEKSNVKDFSLILEQSERESFVSYHKSNKQVEIAIVGGERRDEGVKEINSSEASVNLEYSSVRFLIHLELLLLLELLFRKTK